MRIKENQKWKEKVMINWKSNLSYCDCIDDYNELKTKVLTPHIPIKFNFSNELKTKIYVDGCLCNEIKHLWNNGIRTTGCCCGHGVREPYIGVIEEDIQKMKDMGYIVAPNQFDLRREDSFLPIGYTKLEKRLVYK